MASKLASTKLKLWTIWSGKLHCSCGQISRQPVKRGQRLLSITWQSQQSNCHHKAFRQRASGSCSCGLPASSTTTCLNPAWQENHVAVSTPSQCFCRQYQYDIPPPCCCCLASSSCPPPYVHATTKPQSLPPVRLPTTLELLCNRTGQAKAEPYRTTCHTSSLLRPVKVQTRPHTYTALIAQSVAARVSHQPAPEPTNSKPTSLADTRRLRINSRLHNRREKNRAAMPCPILPYHVTP